MQRLYNLRTTLPQSRRGLGRHPLPAAAQDLTSTGFPHLSVLRSQNTRLTQNAFPDELSGVIQITAIVFWTILFDKWSARLPTTD